MDAALLSTIVWGVLAGIALAYVLAKLLRPSPESPKPLPFLKDQRPWILLVRPDDAKDDPFVITVKRLAYQYEVPVQEVPPSQSPYPLPSHIMAVVFQGRFLWFTKNTFDKDLFQLSLAAARESWNNYLHAYRASLRRSVVLLPPGFYATHGAEFADSYLAAAFFDPGDYEIADDGGIETDNVGIPYHPYMYEGIRMVGATIRDLRNFEPVREFVYVSRPRHVEENL